MSRAAEGVGFAAMVGGLYLVWPPLALVVGGALLVFLAWVTEKERGG